MKYMCKSVHGNPEGEKMSLERDNDVLVQKLSFFLSFPENETIADIKHVFLKVKVKVNAKWIIATRAY